MSTHSATTPDTAARAPARGRPLAALARPDVVACAGLVLLGLAVYGTHVARGGFYWDDWQLAGRARFPPLVSPNFDGTIDLTMLGYRPVLALILPAVHAVLGPDPARHLALALALAVGVSLCFLWFLRTVGVPRVPATLMAALALLFPWADATRFWATAGINLVGVALYLLATTIALHGLRSPARAPRALALGALALLLTVLGVLTYEVAAPAALLSVVLYLRAAPRGRALRRWALDVAAVGGASLFVALRTPRAMEPLAGMVDHAATIGDQLLTLLARSAVPFGAVPREPVLLALAAVLLAAGVLARRRPAGDPLRAELVRWLGVAAVGALGVLAAYALFVPADAHYQPLAPGVNNRINLMGALPYAALVVAVAMLAGTLVAEAALRGRRRTSLATAIAAALVVAVGVGYVVRLERDERSWQRSAAAQERVLAAVGRAVPDPPPFSVLYTYGERTYEAPGIPIFSVSWDLKAALKLRYDRRAIRGYALGPEADLRCGAGRLVPRSGAYGETEGARYGRAYLVDVRTATATPIGSRSDCLAARGALRRG